VTGSLTQAASKIRHAPDRWLHQRRHERAIALVPAFAAGDRLLVVCYGNVCRSPYAAAVIQRQLADTGVLVESAGFVGEGRCVPKEAHDTARALGVDLSAHRSRVLTESMVREARLIVVMDASQQWRLTRKGFGVPLLLGDLDPEPIEKRAIRDPWGQSLPIFSEVFARIDRCAAVLALAIGAANRRVPTSGAYNSVYRATALPTP
jgi:protein-tyrosine phosphatase